jgi:hypothetical protein
VTPLRLDVRAAEWFQSRKNKGPPRQQSAVKDEEIRRQFTKLLELNVIQQSVAGSYSQVHLVSKPGGKFRLTLDYRLLNEYTETTGGVIPNIGHMLDRIGKARPTVFAVVDFTSGYHQAALDPESYKFTAFITSTGVYEWNHVAVGLKGAPTYFQRQMGEVVLQRLLFHTCE